MASISKTFVGSQAIPDSNLTGISNALSIALPTGAQISGLTVSLDITHTYTGDLDIYLKGPNGVQIALSRDNGGGSDNYTGTTFTDTALTSATFGAAPYTGLFKPENPLSLLLAGNGSGLWTLVVVDDAGGDLGTLDGWSITLDYLAGNGSSNSETLVGTADTDRMYGRAGNDKINALAGDDFLFGGDGTDTLTGGLGRDIMRGDDAVSVRDIFDFNSIKETGKTATTRDIIRDFTHLVDDIDLKTIDANTKLAGNQAFKFIGQQAFHRVAGELHFQKIGGNTIVSGDVDGNGTADFQIQLNGLLNLTKVDFIL